jgi:hypothetical protein
MRTRKFDWLDIRTNTPKYGIEVFVNGKWMQLYDKENGVPVLFDSESERDQERATLRAIAPRENEPA